MGPQGGGMGPSGQGGGLLRVMTAPDRTGPHPQLSMSFHGQQGGGGSATTPHAAEGTGGLAALGWGDKPLTHFAGPRGEPPSQPSTGATGGVSGNGMGMGAEGLGGAYPPSMGMTGGGGRAPPLVMQAYPPRVGSGGVMLQNMPYGMPLQHAPGFGGGGPMQPVVGGWTNLHPQGGVPPPLPQATGRGLDAVMQASQMGQ